MSDLLRKNQQRMFAWIEALPAQLAASGGSPGLDGLRPLAVAPRQILCCGMGGSAVAAGLLADGWPGLTVPVAVWRDYGLPAWADPRTLVIACSHSGNTAETLAAVAEARRRGCPLVALASGGRLSEMAAGTDGQGGFPAVGLPGGQPPRTVLGAALGALLHLLHRLGCLPDPAPTIAGACGQVAAGDLVRLPDGRLAGPGQAQTLAKHLAGRFPVIYTAGSRAHGAGRRWLAQLNENAKVAGHHACFPELAHNEIVGWNLPGDQRERFALVVLRDQDADPVATRVVDASLALLVDQFAGVHQLAASGPDHLARVLGLIVFGDLVSAHLAVATGVDPVPIARIDALKARLGDG